MNAQIDIRPILPMIQVPTLILHRALDRCLKVEEGRFLAEQIPGARFVELPGHDHLPFVGDQETMLDHIEAFVGGVRSASGDYRVLATVLVARLVHGNSGQRAVQDPPELKNRFEARAIREVELFRGTNFAYFGDSFHAIFDGPTRAIRAAIAITDSAARHGLRLQTGLHIGECDIVGNAIGGAAVKFAEQICSFAAAEEILVSNPVKDLVAGSGISFLEHIPIDRSTSTDQLKLFRVVH